MATRVPTYKSAKHVPPGDTSAFGTVHLAAHFLGLCAAISYIDRKSAPLYAPLALLMARIAAHFGRFSTNEPTIEPTKTQDIDERTQESDERTQDFANEPEVRLVAPGRKTGAVSEGCGRCVRQVLTLSGKPGTRDRRIRRTTPPTA